MQKVLVCARRPLSESGAFVERVINRIKPNNIDENATGYYLERKAIFEYENKADNSQI